MLNDEIALYLEELTREISTLGESGVVSPDSPADNLSAEDSLCLKAALQETARYVDQELDKNLEPVGATLGGQATEAARYMLLAPGKRLRPTLLLRTAALYDVPAARALDFALALEMIHCYSLIHDDLPAMDNDELRRGLPTCHVKYGEAVAILAGDLLLTRAGELLVGAQVPVSARGGLEKEAPVKAAMVIMGAAGDRGMIAGQCLDLKSTGHTLSKREILLLQMLKTSALLASAVEAGAYLGNAGKEEIDLWRRYGILLGLAFQLSDDILDKTGDSVTLGKSTGKDARDDKATFVTTFGLERTREVLRFLTRKSQDVLAGIAAIANRNLRFYELLSKSMINRLY